ncbi:MAG TPA: hypothetical protein QGF95_26775 [Candidatus Latescibacteria bacterium]|jgi:hypothetical protein|nr:hypothetical protein [Gemmatimonadaceae bacterium]MDP6016373.1 hypothetical protein [Candidatus Latescibacterota bacterium]HJP34168.1 hypothetical protein [Candidatus Latescibacterota bacterium]
MSPTTDSSLQLIFVDVLFLCLAGGLALWFRSWLQEQQRAMDRRLEALEEQQQVLTRVTERLTSACRGLERPSAAVDAIARSGTRTDRVAAPAPPVEAPMAVADRQVQTPRVTAVGGPKHVAIDTPDATGPRAASGAPAGRQRVDTPAAKADRQWEELTDRSREAYRRARDLLEQGVPPNDIARQVGLGVAEVNVLKRMRDAGRR